MFYESYGSDLIFALLNCLSASHDTHKDLVHNLLEAIGKLLQLDLDYPDDIMGEDKVAYAVATNCDGLEIIEKLEKSVWEEVSLLSTKLLETYFNWEEFEIKSTF